MREIVYKGQHCWLISDVERLIARKDEEIAELKEKLKPEKKAESKKDRKKEGKVINKDDKVKGDAVEDDEGPDELGERPKSDDFNPPNLGTPLTGDGIMGKSSK